MINLNNSSILCTGGNGFIGSNFIEYLDNNFIDVKIFNIDKMGVGSRNLEIVGSSVLGEASFEKTKHKNLYRSLMMDLYLIAHYGFPKDLKFDYVFHFAAESHVDRSINLPASFISNNVMGTTALLEYCRIHQPQARIIQVGTDEVYGHLKLNESPFTENSNLHPRSPYSASKASADLIAGSYHSTYDMDIITTRCCNNYGPHQHSEKFIPTVIRSLKNKEKIPVYGTGENIREWIYVDDHNKSLLEIAEIGRSGTTYNIGSGIEKTNLELIEDIIELGNFGGSIEDHIKFVDDRKGHDFRYAITSLHYNRRFELYNYKQALKETIKFYLNFEP